MSLSSFNYIDYIYLGTLILFLIFFSIKGATQSINYSLKIILSISLPFIFYKRSLSFFLESLNSEYLNDLANKNSIFLEIILFVCLFLFVYFVYSLIEKAINIKSPSQLEFKIIDIIVGGLYGLFLFSILFYLSYSLILKNHIKGNNIIYQYNIHFYEGLLNKETVNKDKSSDDNKRNAQEKLY
mgnify:FL=1|tara:strand:+ start:2753 stop:3304 length:552 start_codon:yes stop_codon:yes gene_type:complete